MTADRARGTGRVPPVLWWSVGLAVASVGWLVAQYFHPLLVPIVGWLPSPPATLLAAITCFRAAAASRAIADAACFWFSLGVTLLFMTAAVTCNPAGRISAQASDGQPLSVSRPPAPARWVFPTWR